MKRSLRGNEKTFSPQRTEVFAGSLGCTEALVVEFPPKKTIRADKVPRSLLPRFTHRDVIPAKAGTFPTSFESVLLKRTPPVACGRV